MSAFSVNPNKGQEFLDLLNKVVDDFMRELSSDSR
jgi:hypothetical protein